MAGDHPDRALVDRYRALLDRWLETPSATPTSQITGGGAVGAAERALSVRHGDRPALLVPSATAGMLGVLVALGVRAGDDVLVPAVDWTASVAAVRALGARPVAVAVDEATWTMDPAAAASARTPRTRAVVACHLFGVPADVPALRAALPDLAVVEDCAQAFGSTLDGRPVGTWGDAAVFSFGPGKQPIDAGEAGAIVVRETSLRDDVLRVVGHPVRQRLAGLQDVRTDALCTRVHPFAAMALAVRLASIDTASTMRAHDRLADRVRAAGVVALGDDPRRRVAAPTVVVAHPPASLPLDLRAHRVEVTDIGALIDGESRTRAAFRISGAAT